MNERQRFRQTNLPASKFLAIRAINGTVSAPISANSTLTQWRDAIKSLPEYANGVVTVTQPDGLGMNADPVTGESRYSAITYIEFGGNLAGKNVPQLVIISGEHMRLEMAGEAVTGTLNGATIPVGMSAAAAQAALRATSGDWSGVVVKGSSS